MAALMVASGHTGVSLRPLHMIMFLNAWWYRPLFVGILAPLLLGGLGRYGGGRGLAWLRALCFPCPGVLVSACPRAPSGTRLRALVSCWGLHIGPSFESGRYLMVMGADAEQLLHLVRRNFPHGALQASRLISTLAFMHFSITVYIPSCRTGWYLMLRTPR
ncbi:uncharacterized protein BDW47DRAFT_98394 [Aspergillus candidus]|uniref:Uncharacterized protein n=1 Tax=Aspergillus candidus TaxID=41067 RepID=A0A2I2FM32_ASPCN|nr:hypothetical protein BDW47DRAFT_98394 [Aspergillus candidus]PLB41697.1 hypothetical protein BDW47DRAFT_98394 [Aspergillus candidus]